MYNDTVEIQQQLQDAHNPRVKLKSKRQNPLQVKISIPKKINAEIKTFPL